MAGKRFLRKVASITLSCTVSKTNAFFAFYAELKNAHQEARKWFSGNVDSSDTLGMKNFVKIAHII